MTYSRLHSQFRKIFALLAAILILPSLAPAGQNGTGQDNVSKSPDANTGIVLIPLVGAVLVFSAFQLLRAKAAPKKDWWSGCSMGMSSRLKTGLLGIDEACSGILFHQATLVVALFLGELYRVAWQRRVVLALFGSS
jgi:uncharacterized membrane protein